MQELVEYLLMLTSLLDNAHEIIQTLIKQNQQQLKVLLKSIYLSSTMSPGIALDPKAV
jgi:large subunit ribosomal protein L1